ncbi:MAG: hypothetical protein M3Z96_06865 [Pseudomonadota bacterium]|nr:hypothetical protein [Pseudomonadota bacterium]
MQNNHSNGSCAALALGLAISFALPARADTITNRIYPSDPTQWTLMGGAFKYPSAAAIAPDGSATTPIQAGSSRGGLGSRNPVPVTAGEVDTFSVYFRYMVGIRTNAYLCLNGAVIGQTGKQCLTFNAIAGTYVANDPGIIDYSIAPVGGDGWFRVSIVFKTTVGGVATASVQADPGQLFAAWGAQFVSGPYPGQLIPTVAAAASGTNQINPNPDSENLWSATNGAAVQAPGRAGWATPEWTFSATSGAPNTVSTGIITPSESVTPVYYYAYISKSSNFAMTIALNYGCADCNHKAPVQYFFGKFFAYNVSQTAFIAYHPYNIFDAGDQYVLWATMPIALDWPGHNVGVTVQLSNGVPGISAIQSVTFGRFGIQAGGVFP